MGLFSRRTTGLVSSALIAATFFAFSFPAHAQKSTGAASDFTIPVFEKRQIMLGGKTLTVEIADDHEKRQRGLMFRKSLPADDGMLFIFDSEQPLSFWMMNTLIPLSIGYFTADQKLIETREMVPAVLGEAQPKTYPSSRPAKYALEMPKGWFKHNGVKPGAAFTFVGKH